jgi:tricorn protease
VALALALRAAVAALAGDGAPPRGLLRYPDHADGRVVFVSQNDLWIAPESGGVARRITALPGVESHPKFSPDGRWIAFDGQFQGGTAIYVMPSQGGEPRRLTFHPEDSSVVDWSPDGRRVLFTSGRLTAFRGGVTRLFEVSAKGGPPEVLPTDMGSAASYSPDGTALVFTRHTLRSWWRKGYTGSQADTLWLFERHTAAITPLTEGHGQDRWPMWAADGRIYFTSERDGVANLYALDRVTRAVQRVTDHADRGVEWPSLGEAGKTIIYGRDGSLWLLDVATRRNSALKIEVPGAPARPLVEWINPFKDYFKAARPSPSGRLIAIEARGEIFTVPVRAGDTRNLTRSPGARESEAAWSPDGRYIACLSDASGELEVFLLDPQGAAPPRQLTETGDLKRGLAWSGDSRRLVFETHDHTLTVLDVETRRLTPIVQSRIGAISQYTFSPDGGWIAYVLPGTGGYGALWLHSFAQGKAFPVTSGQGSESSPVFDPAGRFLYFLSSGRSLVWSPNLMAPAPRSQTAVMALSLRSEDHDPFAAPADREPTEATPKDGPANTARAGTSAMVVETEGLEDRVRRLPIPPGDYRRLAANEARVFFLSEPPGAKPKLVAWDLTRRETVDLAEPVTSYELSGRGDHILLLQPENKLQVFPSNERPKPGEGMADTSNLVMRLDRRAEWRQMFEEFVRVMRDQFYVENFHGRDWPALAAHYRNQLASLTTREELTELFLEMVGELNVSHQGAGGGDVEKVPAVSAGLLGAELTPDAASGRYRFAKIYKGGVADPQWRAPLDGKRVREGDYLLRIAGADVQADEDYLVHLMGLKGRISLTTSHTASGADAVDTTVELIGAREAADLRHADWIRRNEAVVEARGGGRIGYVGLTDMQQQGMTEFMRGITENRMKDGLILDCRNNAGGSIEKEVIDLLERRAWMMIRQDRYVEPMWRPQDGFYGHIAVLVNEYSVSDAELFPIGFKARGLGILVGVPGSGANLGAPNYDLVDGGFVRLGVIGLWGADGRQFEGFAQAPDLVVANLPADVVRGRDAQLEASVDALLARIGREPVRRPPDVKIEKKVFR